MTGRPKCAEHQACYRSPPWVSTRPALTDELKEHPVLGFRQLHDHLQAFKTGLNEATGIAEAARRESNEDRSIGLWQSLFCQRLHGAQGGRQTVSDRSAVLLEHQLNELKLWTFQREYGKVAGQCVTEDVDHPGYLLRLSELELIHRHHRMVERRIRLARFPATKTLDTFNFLAMPSATVAPTRPTWPSAWGPVACQMGLSVGFTTAASLVELIEARDERRLLNLQNELARLKLLIIDKLGFNMWPS